MPRNFELPRVKSINTSGHKFGLVYAGVGWIIWRDEALLPKHLVFELHYLGGTEESYTLNFSRPGAQVIAQYYNLMHLGFTGYQNIMVSQTRLRKLDAMKQNKMTDRRAGKLSCQCQTAQPQLGSDHLVQMCQ